MRADSTPSGACTSGAAAPQRGATRRASGGASTTCTASAEKARPRDVTAPCCRRQIMSDAEIGAGAPRFESENAAAPGAADWLCLAATPTFATMALLTGALDVGPPQMLCSATQHGSSLNGMVVMYLLMSAFHSAPWLKLRSLRRLRFRAGVGGA